MTDNSAILSKIAKLRAKAQGTDNKNEAEIFAAKVAELMAEHNLEEAQLNARTNGSAPIGDHTFTGRAPDRWRELIVMGCAELYWCKLYIKHTGRGKRQFVFCGREHNAVVAMAMTEYLFATVKRMAREFSPNRATQTDFRKGASLTLYSRMVAMAKAQRTEPSTVKGRGNLPVVVEQEQVALASYMADKGLGQARRGKGMRMGVAGGIAGKAAGNRIQLNKQVAEKRSNRLLA